MCLLWLACVREAEGGRAPPRLPCNPKAHPVETCPDGHPCPPSGYCPTETWWQLNSTDCDANDNVGTCSGTTIEACEKECDSLESLNSSGCDGFNWPHKHFKSKGCYSRKRPLSGLTLYVRQTGPQPPPPPPAPAPSPSPAGTRYWWQFNETDCLAGQEFGTCTAGER